MNSNTTVVHFILFWLLCAFLAQDCNGAELLASSDFDFFDFFRWNEIPVNADVAVLVPFKSELSRLSASTDATQTGIVTYFEKQEQRERCGVSGKTYTKATAASFTERCSGSDAQIRVDSVTYIISCSCTSSSCDNPLDLANHADFVAHRKGEWVTFGSCIAPTQVTPQPTPQEGTPAPTADNTDELWGEVDDNENEPGPSKSAETGDFPIEIVLGASCGVLLLAVVFMYSRKSKSSATPPSPQAANAQEIPGETAEIVKI